MHLDCEGLFFDEGDISNKSFYDEKTFTLVCNSGKDRIPFRSDVFMDSSESECFRCERLDCEVELMFEGILHERDGCFSILGENETGVF